MRPKKTIILRLVAAVYVLTWFMLVPAANHKLLKKADACLGIPDKVFTPEPSSLLLLSPYLQHRQKTIRHIYIEYPYESEELIETTVIPVAPFLAFGEYKLQSSGFMCGGAGFMAIGFNYYKFWQIESYGT